MKVLVTRAREAGEKTASRLRQRGYDPVLLPLFENCDTGAALPETEFDAVAFTSSAAIHVLAARPADEWSRLLKFPIFCVGEATAQAARDAGFHKTFIGAGTAADLPGLILAELAPAETQKSAPPRLLYPAPHDRAFDLAAALPGVMVSEILIYRAEALDPGRKALEAALMSCAGGAALLYSARSAEHLATLATKHALADRLAGLTLIAISENVARAIAGRGLPDILVSEMPHEDGLFERLDRLDRNGKASPRNDEDNEEGHH
ncbi:MAG: uroporphyrinogen-III synthase [Salaquimonas sp.]|jgi:uroporphyrinogen-III synthase|nr:uroporphyrinogen-III synthase [Salaquimonas sp.]